MGIADWQVVWYQRFLGELNMPDEQYLAFLLRFKRDTRAGPWRVLLANPNGLKSKELPIAVSNP